MALEEYVGAIVMEIDGKEVDIESFDASERTGRKLVKTMNKTGRAKGFAQGVPDFDLKIAVVIPKSGDMDWASIQGAKITISPVNGGGQRVSYMDCFTLDVGNKYQVDGEARRDLSMAALRKVVG